MKREEDLIQAEFHQWLYKNYPQVRLCAYHIPNEQNRQHISGLIGMGLVTGMPDYHIAIKRGSYTGMFIEFKKPGGKTSDAQKAVQSKLTIADHYVVTCHSTEEAKQEFIKFWGE